jgi:DNA-binding CsgD family transcriptional regulator
VKAAILQCCLQSGPGEFAAPFLPFSARVRSHWDMGATAAAGVIGRDDELASLVDVFSNLERLPQTIVVEGEAGMGKTTLVRVGIDIAGGLSYRVLSCSPAEAERELSFVGLRDLLDDAYDDVAAELPEPQRRSLAVALLRDEPTGGPTDVGAVAAAFLSALRRLVRDTPLLVAIDDLHWLDAASRTVLQFAVRRLRHERVALLVAQRTDSIRYGPALGRALGEERVRRIGVEGMSLGAAHALLRTRLELSLPRPTLRRLHAAAGGNPLLVLEVGRALKSHDELPAPAEPLPVPPTLQELLDVRISNLSPKTRHLLPAIAALSRPTMDALDRFARRSGNDAAIDDGVAAGVLALDGARVSFTHPLFATHVYSTLSSSKRRDLHRRLAEIISDAEERARHLALSTETPDEATARALEHAAAAASARGAATSAAELADEARRLTPGAQEEDAWRRTIDAARYHFLAGDAARASDILTTVLPAVPPGPVRSSALSVLARIKLFTDNLASAAELFAEAAAQPATKREARAEANEGLAWSLILSRGDVRTAARHARIAATLTSQSGDDTAFAETLATQGLSNFLAGKRSGVAAVRRAATVARTAEYSRTVRHPDWALAAALVWSDELSAAEETLKGLHRRALERGDDSSLARILFAVSYVQLLKGDWSAARRNAASGHEIAVETGQQPQAGLLLASKALVDAHFGDVDAARAWAEQEVGADRENEQRAAALIHRVVLGFIELSLGNWNETHRQLSPVVERVTSSGIAEPGALWFVPDDIEALVYLKRLDDARRLLEPLERSASDLKRKSAIAACARCRGLLHAASGDFSSAAKSFQYALATQEAVGMPFALARTLLAFGIVQRRAKQRRQARALLQQALMTFDALGASVWCGRAQTELARIGGRRATTTLTATEQRVAELVALGRSNKEVASALFVTVKTVEATLSRIYTKLGIRSRAALARRFALDQGHDADRGGAAKL